MTNAILAEPTVKNYATVRGVKSTMIKSALNCEVYKKTVLNVECSVSVQQKRNPLQHNYKFRYKTFPKQLNGTVGPVKQIRQQKQSDIPPSEPQKI